MDMLDARLQKADRLAAITQQVGFALWQLQELEGVAAQYFVLVAQAKKGMGLAAGIALLDKAQSKTFGTTIHQIARVGLLSAELDRRFSALLAERNWLVHKSRASSRNAIHSDSAAEKFVARLDAIAEESSALLKELGTLAERHVKQHGVTEQQIAAGATRLLEQWHDADAI